MSYPQFHRECHVMASIYRKPSIYFRPKPPYSWSWNVSATVHTSFNNINTSSKRTICMSNSQIKNVNRWQLNILIHTVFLLLVSFWQLWIVTWKVLKITQIQALAQNSFFLLPFCCDTVLDTANNNVSITHKTTAVILK